MKRQADRREAALRSEFSQAVSFVTRQASNSQERQLDLLEKAFAQLRAADPWQYQSIMSMNGATQYDEVYDPSPEAEAERIAERQNKKEELNDSLTAEEEDVLGDLFPGRSFL